MIKNKDITDILSELVQLMEFKGENPFKIRAFQKAIRQIETTPRDYASMDMDALLQIEGIGKGIAEKIIEIAQTGQVDYIRKARLDIPVGIFELFNIHGLGPKRLRQIYIQLGVSSPGELEYACQENRLSNLSGFGEKLQATIYHNLRIMNSYKGLYLFSQARICADLLMTYLQSKYPQAVFTLAGSLRRRNETVHDIDILASQIDRRDWQALCEFFKHILDTHQVISAGEKKLSLWISETLLQSLLQFGSNPAEDHTAPDRLIGVDIRWVTTEAYPYSLLHFTGSKEHNTHLRSLAKKRNLLLNDYGLWDKDQSLPAVSEEDIFHHLGLDFIPPELREDNGEIEVASRHELPELLQPNQIRGFFHFHTTFSDGADTLEDMARASLDRGFSFIGLTDHSRSSFYANGLSIDRIMQQKEEVERVRSLFQRLTIFWGIESDILADGNLDYPDHILALFDFVIGSIHSQFNQTAEKMQARLEQALANPYLSMLGHPTGRLLLSRAAYAVNVPELISAAARWHKILEINANPYRLDLDWRYLKSAKDQGVLFAINPDAHRVEGIDDLFYGIGIARKGWLTSSNVINTCSEQELYQLFKPK